jgi:hypothetical protein
VVRQQLQRLPAAQAVCHPEHRFQQARADGGDGGDVGYQA